MAGFKFLKIPGTIILIVQMHGLDQLPGRSYGFGGGRLGLR
jgi:hypothetical protein